MGRASQIGVGSSIDRRRLFPPIVPPVPRVRQADRAAHADVAQVVEVPAQGSLAAALSAPYRVPADGDGVPMPTPFGVLLDDAASLDGVAGRWVRGLGVEEALRRVAVIEDAERDFLALMRGRISDRALEEHAAIAARVCGGLRARVGAHAADAADFVRDFAADANAVASEMLARSRAKLEGVRDVYRLRRLPVNRGGVTGHVVADNVATRSLRAGARELHVRLGVVADLSARLRASENAPPDSPLARDASRFGSAVELARRDLAAHAAELGRVHPVLLDAMLPSAPARMLEQLAGTREEVARALGEYDAHALEAIDRMERRLAAHPEAVLRLGPVVAATKLARGIDPASLGASYVDHASASLEHEHALGDMLLTVATVALSVCAAMPSGGASLAVLSALLVGADAVALSRSAEDYAFASDATVLAGEPPSAVWLLVQALGFVAGAPATIGALAKGRFARLIAERTPAGDAARSADAQLGRARAEALLGALGVERFGAIGRELPAGVLERLVDRHGAATIAWAIRDLHPRAAAELLDRFDARTLDALTGGISARTLRTAAFELGDELVDALARIAGPRGVLVVHGRFGQSLRRIGVTVEAGAVHLAGGPGVDLSSFFDLATGPVERLERFSRVSPMLARVDGVELRSVSADELALLAEAVEARLAGDAPRTRAAMDQLRARRGSPLPRLAQRAAEGELQINPRARPRGVAAEGPQVAPEMQAVAEWIDEPARATNGPKPHGARFFGNEALPSEVRLAVAARVERAHVSGRFEAEGLRRWVARIDEVSSGRFASEADRLRAVDDCVFELDHALAVLGRSDVARDGVIVLGARPNNSYTLAPGYVFEFRSINGEAIMSEADVLFLGKDGKVHIDEVKRTANALAKKIEQAGRDNRRRSAYLARMSAWQAQSPHHVASVVVMQEQGWARAADLIDGLDQSSLTLCRNHGVEVEISGLGLPAARWDEIEQRLGREPRLRERSPADLLGGDPL